MAQIVRDAQLLENSIMATLPSVAFIQDQVGLAIKIAKKYLVKVERRFDKEDNIYLHSLRVALKVAEFAKKKSNIATFRYDLIVIALLHDILEDADGPELRQDLKIFEISGNNTILDGVQALTNDVDKMEHLGQSNYKSLKFYELIKNNKDLFLVKIIDRLDNVRGLRHIEETEEFKKDPEKADLWRDKYLMETLIADMNLINAKVVIPDEIHPYHNELRILLASFKF